MNEISKRENMEKILANAVEVEYHPVLPEESLQLENGMKIPFGQLSSIGAGLSALPESFRTVSQTEQTGEKGLFRLIIPDGATGKLVQKNGITLGNMVGADGHTFSARARFAEVAETSRTTTNVMPIEPATMFMSAALMSIEKKLDDIKEIQLEILDFLQDDKKSKQRGNVSVLSEILNNFKFNWKNDTYRSSMHIKVLDIKQEAVQNIDFYRGQIKKKISKKGLLIVDQDINGRLKKAQEEFRNYQLAVYVFGFSSFLEIMLLGNYDSGYLQSIRTKISEYMLEYRQLYTDCYNLLEGNAKKSLQTHFLDGIAGVTGVAGNVIAKIPVISKTQIDETLIASGERLEQYSSKRPRQMMRQFVSNANTCVKPFIDGIENVDRLYNKPMQVLFDKENLYLIGQAT